MGTGFASSAVIPKSIQDALLERLKAETLGDYEILTEVGRGGMATVYLAHDIALDRKVAIKVMSSAIVDEGMAERFRREARTAAALNHPHIIPIYAVRDRYPLLFFAMKFIAGQSLDPILKIAGGLPIPMVQTILSQAGSALGYAHRRGVIHRDVKPANIMIDDEGWVVVTDFGIAKVSSATGLTVTGVTVGTPAYMSPEQCLGKEVTGASDQYSLGIVAYEMLTGLPPFSADSAMAVMFAQFQETPKPILDSRTDCPPRLAEIVMRMLEKEPEKRWPTIDDAVAAIGASPLPHDDPTRKQLISMALSSENAGLTRRISTPTSPAPAVRRSGRTTVPSEVLADSQTPVAPGSLGETIQYPRMAQPAVAGDTPVTPPRAAVQAPAVHLPSRAPRRRSRVPWIAAAVVLAGVVTFAVARRNGEREDSMSPPVAPAESTVAETPTPAPPAAVNAPTTDSVTTGSPPKAVDRVTLALSRSSFQVGESLKLSAVAEAADGTPLLDRRIEWSSSAPGVARVTENGTLRALRPGQATIIATVEGRSTTTKIEVVPPATQPPAREPIAAMSVVPDAAPLAVGSTMALSAVLRDGSGKRLEDRTITWTSSSSAVSVFPNGQILAVGPGTVVVTASSEGRSASATITVSAVPVASLGLTGAPSDLNVGDSVRLNAAARDAKGGALANRQTTWESSDPNVATVSGGLVIARSPGTATISATSEGKATTAKIRVTGPPPVDPAAEKARAVDQVGKGIAAFVAALNSRDMTRLRQAYPGMTPAEESDWGKLLNEKSITKFEAVLEDAQAPTIEATSAEEQFQLRLALTYSGLPTETQRIRYQGIFRPDGGTWKLMRLNQR